MPPPAPAAERAALLAAQADIARLFLAQARPLAARHGAAWPEAFETAARAHLRRELGLEIQLAAPHARPFVSGETFRKQACLA